MAVTALYEGTQAVSTTEWSCTADASGPVAATDAATVQVFLDVADMVAGDQLRIKVYEKIQSGLSQREIYSAVLTGTQTDSWVSPALCLMYGWDVTLEALAGTITVYWSLRKP